MKKIVLLLVAIVSLSFTSCKKDDESPSAGPSIVGTWNVDKLMDKENEEVDHQYDGRSFIKISADKSYTYFYLNSEKNGIRLRENGTYVSTNNTIEFSERIEEEKIKNGSVVFKNDDTIELMQEGEDSYSLILVRVGSEEAKLLDALPTDLPD